MDVKHDGVYSPLVGLHLPWRILRSEYLVGKSL